MTVYKTGFVRPEHIIIHGQTRDEQKKTYVFSVTYLEPHKSPSKSPLQLQIATGKTIHFF